MDKKFLDIFMQIYANSLGDEIFITDTEGNILHLNQCAFKTYKNISNILKISHLFNFEVCILNSDDIIFYTPIRAALISKEKFYSSVTKQINEKLYIEYSLIAFNVDENKKLFILRNDSCNNLIKENKELDSENTKLQKQILNMQKQKTNLETKLIRTNLINMVSHTVREYINTDKIIKIVMSEIKKTLNINEITFSVERNTESKIFSEIDKNFSFQKLIVPVSHNDNVAGSLILVRNDVQNMWQKEEIDLLNNIADIIGTSFAKEELYKKLEKQKEELENALVQLKNAQLQIIQTEKLAALGKLVAGVAHEINTPLGAVCSNLNLLDKYTKRATSLSEVQEILSDIRPINEEALKRIDTLVKSLKNFARLDEAKKKIVNITDGIDSSLALLGHEMKNKIEIIKNYGDIPEICCYPDYINQIFMNILLNACQSIETKGKITITTKRENDFVKITISDTGNGIPTEIKDKIFDFGFTTKKFGEGTGLGLALAKKIVEEHNGKIEVTSEHGKGTSFFIYLPI